ncbi:2-deoxyribose-5-phosphate aldolase [Aspergillus saccharolyticus JOP 1030-1]|uniref:deoxyribose-phosphate aldolase n=1 Tax=Aspergillus saccharolyticus JOP 1030-1 TaxID=1450539 RepID=A0A318ZE50_9EURO|nr:deoxyribose-phosphate aldolase [Aspergillus saccharolyticus JOP 1030-1]PYH44897.1 deoxyribose-phosphate aldolase [Aspergillus saccharolyticus JOP 1030-1]
MPSNPTIPATNSDWTALITQTHRTITSLEPVTYTTTTPVSETIDHTQLSLTATPEQIDTLCTEARTHNFATVCVRLRYVARAVENLHHSAPPQTQTQNLQASSPAKNTPGIACVISFHEGTAPTSSKVTEALAAVSAGATELDMVLNRPLLQQGEYAAVYEDIQAVRAAIPASVGLKVILETGRLGSAEEVVAGSVVACLAGADYIKTSTGFDGPGARVEDVRVMRAVADALGTGTKVKASGGVRSRADWRRMVEAGAERIGSSSGVRIVVGSGDEKGKVEGY